MAKTFRRKSLRKTRSNKKSSCRNRKIKGGVKITKAAFLTALLGAQSVSALPPVSDKDQQYQLSQTAVKHSFKSKVKLDEVTYEGRVTPDPEHKFFFTTDKAFKDKVLEKGGNDPTANFTWNGEDVFIMGRDELCGLGSFTEYYDRSFHRKPTVLPCVTKTISEGHNLGYIPNGMPPSDR